MLAFVRRLDGEALLVMFNLGASAVELTLPTLAGSKRTTIEGHGLQADSLRDDVHLPGHGAWFARLD